MSAQLRALGVLTLCLFSNACLLEVNLRSGLLPEDHESILLERLRPGTTVLWGLDPIVPAGANGWDPRLIHYATTGNPRIIIDPFPFGAAESPPIRNYLATTLPDGTLELGELKQRDIVTPWGEELVASGYRGGGFFQAWCDDTIFFVGVSLTLSESVWCTSRALIAPDDGGPTAILVSLTEGGPIYDIDFAGDSATASTLTVPAGVDVDTVVFIDQPSPGVLAFVAEDSGTWSYARTDAAAITATGLTGASAGSEPVLRQLDGTLRITTLTGLYVWDAEGTEAVTLIAASPAPTIQASWVSAGGYGGALALENTPNPVDSSIDMPLAVQARVLINDAFVIYDVPTTPCIETDECREVGESRVIGLVGSPDSPFVIYEIWSWYLSQGSNLDVKALYSSPLL
jgi:hypothetical protein